MVALGFERFEVKLNNRLLLNGLLKHFGIQDDNFPKVLRALDKLDKQGRDVVLADLSAPHGAGLTIEQARKILALVETVAENLPLLDRVAREFGGNSKVDHGVENLRELLSVAGAAGIPAPIVEAATLQIVRYETPPAAVGSIPFLQDQRGWRGKLRFLVRTIAVPRQQLRQQHPRAAATRWGWWLAYPLRAADLVVRYRRMAIRMWTPPLQSRSRGDFGAMAERRATLRAYLRDG